MIRHKHFLHEVSSFRTEVFRSLSQRWIEYHVLCRLLYGFLLFECFAYWQTQNGDCPYGNERRVGLQLQVCFKWDSSDHLDSRITPILIFQVAVHVQTMDTMIHINTLVWPSPARWWMWLDGSPVHERFRRASARWSEGAVWCTLFPYTCCNA